MKNGIPLMGRITTVADVFDALTHERPYKEAWPLERAISWRGSEAISSIRVWWTRSWRSKNS